MDVIERNLFDTQPAAVLGADRSLLASGRLDNLVSCWAATTAIATATPADHTAVIALFVITYAAVSSVQGVAAAQERYHVIGWLGLFSPITLVDGFQTWFLDAHSAFPHAAGPPDAVAGIAYLLVLLGIIAGTFGLLMRRYRKVGLS